MSADITVSVDASEAKELFAKTADRASSFRLVFEEARAFMAAANAENFATGGLPVGGWAPLQPETAAWKVRHGMPPIPLVGDGALFRSLVDLHGPPNDINATSASFGTDVEYAQFHQYGAPRAHLPVRRVVFEPPGFATMLEHAIVKHLEPGPATMSDLKALFR